MAKIGQIMKKSDTSKTRFSKPQSITRYTTLPITIVAMWRISNEPQQLSSFLSHFFFISATSKVDIEIVGVYIWLKRNDDKHLVYGNRWGRTHLRKRMINTIKKIYNVHRVK